MSLASEFSRVVPVAHIDHGEIVQKIEADEVERQAIKDRLKLEGVASLVAEFILRRDKHTALYQVEGEIGATVAQLCVASGEPFEARVTGRIRALYGYEAGLAIDHGDESWDDVEPIVDNEIDIGELAVQHLSLNLNPYPRKPGLESIAVGHSDEKPSSPFAMLKGLVK